MVWNKDTQQGEKATERRKDGEVEQIKKPSIQKTCKGEMREEKRQAGQRTEGVKANYLNKFYQ